MFKIHVARAVLLATLAGGVLTPAVWSDDKAQTEQVQPVKKLLTVGDPAPAIKVEQFLKGSPVSEFKPGHIYVMEFWATWCGPCIRGMPHLTEVQKKFKDKATIIGVDILEERNGSDYTSDTLDKVKGFVEKQGEKMGYTVAYDGASGAMTKAYMEAAGQNGIPAAFVISGDGKIAYIGHPMNEEFEGTIAALADGTFNMEKAIADHKKQAEAEATRKKSMAKFSGLMQEAEGMIGNGEIEKGLAKVDEAVTLIPGAEANVDMYKYQMLTGVGKHAEAGVFASKIIDNAKDPVQSGMLNALAWGIVDPEQPVEGGDKALALRAAEKANALTEGKQAEILDTLARCYWVNGEKSKAIETQTKAVSLAEGRLKADLQKALDAYNAEK